MSKITKIKQKADMMCWRIHLFQICVYFLGYITAFLSLIFQCFNSVCVKFAHIMVIKSAQGNVLPPGPVVF